MRNIEQIYFLLEVINILKNNNYESIGILIDDNHEKQLNSIRESEIEKLKNTLKTDDEIIQLRSNIKKASEAKVANGTMTVTDLLRDINNENQARQNRSLHEIRLYMTVYQLKNNSNN